MKRQSVVLVLVALVATVATLALVAVAGRDRPAMGRGMMAAAGADNDGPGRWDDSWGAVRGGSMMGGRMMSGPMMSGPMMGGRMTGGPIAATSEAGYLAEMVAHHQEAVAAARELARSDRPEMRTLGESVVRTQTAQIDQMTAWLQEWYPDQPPATDYRPMMRDLSGLSGDALDRTFLVDMVPHHMVAVMTSQHLLLRGVEHEQVGDLARSIRDEQHAEILQMQEWLGQWFGAGETGTGPGMMWGRSS